MSLTVRKVLHRAVQVLLVLAVLGAGVGVFRYLVSTRPEPPRKARDAQGLLVEVSSVTRGSAAVHVEARGTVVPARELSVQAEVAGRTLWVNDDLVPGGRLEKGAQLVRIDPRDYRLALEQQKASVDRSGLEVKLEESRKRIAERELELLGKGGDGASALARRDPQLQTAKNAYSAAKSGLERAELQLSKTLLRAPFNAMVMNEQAEVGQLVAPGAPVARLVGTDRFRVQVSVPVDRLAWMSIPGLNADEGTGSAATIRQDVGDGRIVRRGRVVRLLGDLDPAGQMARLLIEIDDPLALLEGTRATRGNTSALPLLLGAYVEVEVEGGSLEDVVEVPRVAVREGNRAYVMNGDDRLEVRELDIVWRQRDSVLVRQGLDTGDRLVVSRVPVAIPGTKLRLAGQAPSAPEGEAKPGTPTADGGEAADGKAS